MARSPDLKVFDRRNVSTDLIKRFAKLVKATQSSRGAPLSPKSALEQYLLAVPLSPEVQNFSDNSLEPPYHSSDKDYLHIVAETAPVLPYTSGYKSDSESYTKSRPKAILCDRDSPDRLTEPEAVDKKGAAIRRRHSLNSSSETDRVAAIRERFRAKVEGADQKKAQRSYTIPQHEASNAGPVPESSDQRVAEVGKTFASSTGVSNATGLDARFLETVSQRRSSIESTPETSRSGFKSHSFHSYGQSPAASSSCLTVKPSVGAHRNAFDVWKLLDVNKSNDRSRSLELANAYLKTSESLRNSSTKFSGGRSKSFNTLQRAWEPLSAESRRKTSDPNNNNNNNNNNDNQGPAITDRRLLTQSDTEGDDVIYRRFHRQRARQTSSFSDTGSDSETDAGSQRERLLPSGLRRRSSSLNSPRRRESSNSRGPIDENNNAQLELGKFENLSVKTLDSGIFEQAVSSLSEDICRLSERYDSDEFLLDDRSSFRSGYSSATESIAESTTTFYDSSEDILDMEGQRNKTRRSSRQPSANGSTFKATALTLSAINKLVAVKNGAKKRTEKLDKPDKQPKAKTTTSKASADQAIKAPAEFDPIQVNQRGALRETAAAGDSVSTPVAGNASSLGTQPSLLTTDNKIVAARKSLPPGCLHSAPLKKESIHARTCSACNRSDKTSEWRRHSVHGRPAQVNSSPAGSAQPKVSDTKPKSTRNCLSPTRAQNADRRDVPTVEEDCFAGQADNRVAFGADELDGSLPNSRTPEREISPSDLASNNRLNNLNRSASFSDGKPEDKYGLPSDNIRNSSTIADCLVLEEQASMDVLEGKLIVRSSDCESDSHVINRGEAIRLQFPLPGSFSEASHAPRLCQASDSSRQFLDQQVQCDFPTLVPAQSCSTCGSGRGLNAELSSTLDERTLKDLIFSLSQHSLAATDTHALQPVDDATGDAGVDSPANIVPLFQNVRMENARLQQLLFEVEQARAGTVKALLHVNGVLNKVQDDNARLEGDMKVLAQEKTFLLENLQTTKEKASTRENVTLGESLGESPSHKTSRSGDHLRLVVDSWKKEKKDLMQALAKSTGASETAQKEAERLRGQYRKVKEQLEHANSAFNETLKNNLAATKRVEEELRASMEDKRQMLLQCDQAKKIKHDFENQCQEMQKLQGSYDELQDEKEALQRRCSSLERQNEALVRETDDLHEQIEHSQEIIEKLTEVEDELREAVGRERSEKEYLQECLDETGQILYQLKHQEKSLVQEKDNLLDDLEAELQAKESLQTTLSKTMDEHQEIMARLETMTNIHITVRESLQQANKKEKTYQEQIEVLTKTSHILHYALEKEKEEHYDLQERHHVMEMEQKKFRTETLSTLRDVQGKLDEATLANATLREEKTDLEKKASDMQASLGLEKDECESLRKQIIRLEKVRENLETEVENLTTGGEILEKDMSSMKKKLCEVQADLKMEKEKHERTSSSLDESEDRFDRVQRELADTRQKLSDASREHADLQAQLKEKLRLTRELESNHAEACCQRDRFSDRLTYFENETKSLRKKLAEQGEEVYSSQVNLNRLTRERDNLKRNCDSVTKDFEDHKLKCTENLKRLREDLSQLQQQMLEKDRLALKAREHYQDQLGSTHEDLKLLRQMVDGDARQHAASKISTVALSNDLAVHRDVNILRMSHDRYRGEFSQHVDRLQEMLKSSRQQGDSVTVVQSPMSKIKLEEIKQLRDEVLDMAADLASVRGKVAGVFADWAGAKLTRRSRRSSTTSESDLSSDQQEKMDKFEGELASLDKVILQLEQRHHAVMNKNAKLLKRTLNEDEHTSLSLVHKFEIITLENENKQLKTLMNLLKRKYEFSEHDLVEELKSIGGGSEVSLVLHASMSADSSHLNGNAYNSDASDSTVASSRTVTARTAASSSSGLSRTCSESNLRYLSGRASSGYAPVSNFRSKGSSLFGNCDRPTSSMGDSAGAGHRSSGFSSNCSSEDYEDEDDDFQPRRLKRHGTLPSRSRRPRP